MPITGESQGSLGLIIPWSRVRVLPGLLLRWTAISIVRFFGHSAAFAETLSLRVACVMYCLRRILRRFFKVTIGHLKIVLSATAFEFPIQSQTT